jgi:hypothetical protein
MQYKRLIASFILGAFCLTTCVGCQTFWAQKPERSNKPAEGPLQLHYHTNQYTYVGQQKVGEAVHKSASGEQVGTTEVYRDKMMTGEHTSLKLERKKLRVDEADFFKFAGRDDLAADIEAERKDAVLYNRIATGTMAVGVAAMVASFLVVPADSPSLRYGLTTGGAVLGVGGYYGAVTFADDLRPTHRFKSEEQTKQAADSFNKEQGFDVPPAYQTETFNGQ